MKQETKQFNFNLPEELKSYLGYMSSKEYSTISQYLIDLVNKDKQQRGLSLEDIDYSLVFSGGNETARYVVMSLLKSDRRKDIRAVDTLNYDGYTYRDIFSQLLNHHRNNRLELEVSDIKVICHPVFKDHLKLTSKPPYTFECEELLYNIIVVYGQTPVVYSIVSNSLPYYNQEKLAAYNDSKMDKTLDQYHIVQRVFSDGTSKFYTKIKVNKVTESVYLHDKNSFDTIGEARHAIQQHNMAYIKTKRFGHILQGDMESAFNSMLSYRSLLFVYPNKPFIKTNQPRIPCSPKYRVEVTEFPTTCWYADELASIESMFTVDVIEEIVHVPKG